MSAAVTKKTAKSSASTPIRSIDSIHASIKNSIATLIRERFNHQRATKTDDGRARAYKRTIHTLADAIIRVFEELIQKMIQISKSGSKQTLGISTFKAAAKLIPGISTFTIGHQAWNNTIDAVIGKSETHAKEYQGWNPGDNKTKNLNEFMADRGFFVRPTALRALVRARLPCRWRLGGGDLTAIAFSVFCSTISETLLEGAGDQMGTSETGKTVALAPRHISKSIEGYSALKSAIGNPVVVGTPLVRRPQLGRKAKRTRRSAPRAAASPKTGSKKRSRSRAKKADVKKFLDVEASEGEEEEGPRLKRSRKAVISEEISSPGSTTSQ